LNDLGKTDWWILLLWIPGVNLAFILYLLFAPTAARARPTVSPYRAAASFSVVSGAATIGLILAIAIPTMHRDGGNALGRGLSPFNPEARSSPAEVVATPAAVASRGGAGMVPGETAGLLGKSGGADEGDSANAQFALGLRYFSGQGVPEDLVQAAAWYRRAADQGHRAAQNLLASMYYYGKGVPQDNALAAYWFRKAADQDVGMAQLMLGNLYHQGRGVSRDDSRAVQWWLRASEKRMAEAEESLGRAYYSGEGVPRDYSRAAEWYRRAAEQGRPSAQTSLGDMYAKGLGVPIDYNQALDWYRRAREQDAARRP